MSQMSKLTELTKLADLEALAVAVEAGSLTAAARQLGWSQPTISRRIARLEQAFDARLLERGAGGTQPTPAGERVVAFATEVVARHAELIASLRADERRFSGSIRIMASTAPATLLPAILAAFSRRQPGVDFDVSLADSAAVASAVLEDRAEVGLSGCLVEDARLDHAPFCVDEIVLVVPGTHRFARRRQISVTELGDEQFVLREAGSGTQEVFYGALAAAGHDLAPLASSITVGSAEAVVAAVSAGLGVGVVSERALAHRSGEVAAVRLAEVSLTRPLWLVRRVGAPRSEPHRAFVEFALGSLADQAPATGR
jgi:DNA-binding transcriptional LysR family regulator